ncbi:MAG: kinesin, partial [Methylobacteriaceae bacterium]|nr:kinesin [Methylobacteriaceae bacterium]
PAAPQVRSDDSRKPATPALSQTGSGSWISDLLDRASREEVPPAAKPKLSAMDTLDSISSNIGGYIDDASIAGVWNSYRQGEKHPFSRQMYTRQGQTQYLEIGDRYRTDSEFKTAVDRFIEEFERLLLEIGPDDPDMQIAQNYLTSDSGKVYTLLAHASGRFG